MLSVIEHISGVRIKSDFFSKSIKLEFYPPQHRATIIYGKNGCGKTTIAQGFRQYSEAVTAPSVVLVPTMNGVDIFADDVQLGKFFVFDEEYITKKVKLKDGGMDAIVLFGEQIEIESKILETEKDILSLQEKVERQTTECKKFTTSTSILSPDYWQILIRNELKKDIGWAGRGSKIKGHRQNMSVTDDVVDRIGQLEPKKLQSELQEEFDRRYQQFMEVELTASALPTSSILPISLIDDQAQRTKDLFKRVVARPHWTEREMSIFSLLSGQRLDTAKAFLSKKEAIICDKCLQPISEEYRISVLQELDSLLNRDVEKFREELKELFVPDIANTAYEVYRDLISYRCVCDRLEDYNKAVVAHNTAVKEKINNPFDPKEYDDSIGLMEANDGLNKALQVLEMEKVNFNRIVSERNTVAKELLAFDEDLSHYAIKDMYKSLKAQHTEKDVADKLLSQMKNNLMVLINEKTKLDAQRKNFILAVEEINHSLEYIFYCKERLSLELGSDKQYHLRINGHTVAPSKVSCGERNALALSYFFTEIAGNMNADAVYTEEVFLVIDDPVSSFDFENRIGVQSLLRWRLNQVLEGCATSKVLILTHDIGTAFDLEKGLQTVKERLKDTSKPAGCKLLKLENFSVSEMNYEKYNEYTILFQRIFEYANSGAGDDLVIGNIMRRVLEAFTTFSYKEGIDKIVLKDSILEILPEHLRDHFKNLMFRLVLNGESHYKEQVCAMRDYNFSQFLSDDEKKRTAKEILSFMYLLNPHHVLAHLPKGAKFDIIGWIDNISQESKSEEKTVKD